MNLKIDVAISLIVGTSDPMTKNRSTKDTLRPSVRHDKVYSSAHPVCVLKTNERAYTTILFSSKQNLQNGITKLCIIRYGL